MFAVARDKQGRAVGCGAIRPMDGGAAEVKRVYATEKGTGIGSAVLAWLEERAKELGYETLRLETRRANERISPSGSANQLRITVPPFPHGF